MTQNAASVQGSHVTALPTQKDQRPRSRFRCKLTGEALRPDSLKIVDRDPIKVTGYDYLSPDPNVVASPLALTISPLHGGTRGVGLEFSRMMLRYLSAVMHELDIHDWRELSDWWESDYGINRVRRGLGEMYSPKRAGEILTWALQCARGETTPADIAREHNHTLAWVARVISNCQWLADKPASMPTKRYHTAA